MSDNITHTVLILALGGSDTLGVVNSHGKLALSRVTTLSSDSTLTNLPSLPDQLFFLISLLLNDIVLGCHVPIEVRLGRLLEQVLLGRQLGNHGLCGERYLFPLWALHIVILVDPAVLILLLVLTIVATTSILIVLAATIARRLFALL